MRLKTLFKIKFRFHFVDNSDGNIEDYIFVTDLPDKNKSFDIVESYLAQNDKSKVLNHISEIVVYNNRLVVE